MYSWERTKTAMLCCCGISGLRCIGVGLKLYCSSKLTNFIGNGVSTYLIVFYFGDVGILKHYWNHVLYLSSQDEVSRRRRVSYQQLESLWEFLNSHRDVAVGYNKTAQAREYSKRMWTTVSQTLNSLGEGATKDWKSWSNYWVDYKAKLKRRVASIRAAQNRTGGGPSEAIPLNDLEKKFLSLLGEGFGSGIPNTQVDPFPIQTQSEHTAPEAGTSNSEAPLVLEHPLTHESVQLEGEEEPALQDSVLEQPQVQQEVAPQQQQQPEETRPRQVPRLPSRRSRRQAALSQQMAREMLVNISRDRMLAEQQNTMYLGQIAEAQERNSQTLQEMLTKLNTIASVIDKSMGSRGPQTGDEGSPDT
ncbi:uncharacterized protein LOC135079689 isoform X1 [Ostrinia nubilalis]|uniref:uncharacterized protein LOC135079689 isoform X1 n=1 Tax=Ostrinia nubilalis TaxID=29057 RepID=UPI0030825B6B